eukprot:scaffold32470_cov37-Cyclotella_meneghiniana.AAC.1
MFVESLTGSSLHEWAKAGLMLRDSLNENSKHFSLYVTGSNGLANQWRSSTGGTSSNANLPGSSNRNIWLKITKTGNVFQAYYKTNANNSNWSSVGSSQTIHFGSGIFYYGVAVTSRVQTSVATLSFKPFDIFEQIQFPLAYNFPQDDTTGVINRSFEQEAFRGGSSATLTNRKFSLVDPNTNMALSVTNCAGVHADGKSYQMQGHALGKFFKFDITDWRKYFGSFTSGGEVSIKQCRFGKTIYTGKIIAWSGNTNIGRRTPSSAGGDWHGNDYIVKPEES